MLSGQYRSDWHSRHWSKINKDGHCLLCPGTNVSGTLEHMLVECPALDDKRRILLNFWNQQAEQNPHLQTLLKKVHSLETAQLVQFLVDPSAVSSVIAACLMSSPSQEPIAMAFIGEDYSLMEGSTQELKL